jgi:hypothetical protein
MLKAPGKIIFLYLFCSLFLAASLALAGEAGEVRCTTPGCRYRQNLKIGGGKISPAVTGYCRSNKEFVRLKLNDWNEYRNTHYCPGTKEPMQPIYDGSQASQIPCPQCRNKTLQYKRRLMFD